MAGSRRERPPDRGQLISGLLGAARGLYQGARKVQRECAVLVEAGTIFESMPQHNLRLGAASMRLANAMVELQAAGENLGEAARIHKEEFDAGHVRADAEA